MVHCIKLWWGVAQHVCHLYAHAAEKGLTDYTGFSQYSTGEFVQAQNCKWEIWFISGLTLCWEGAITWNSTTSISWSHKSLVSSSSKSTEDTTSRHIVMPIQRSSAPHPHLEKYPVAWSFQASKLRITCSRCGLMILERLQQTVGELITWGLHGSGLWVALPRLHGREPLLLKRTKFERVFWKCSKGNMECMLTPTVLIRIM